MTRNAGSPMAVLDQELFDDDDEDLMLDKYLTFRLAEGDYGLPISRVIEIIGMQRITDMPDVAPYVKGVINLRGRVIPVMDVRIRFGLSEREYDDRTCIIVVNRDDVWIGLVVDRVSEVVDIPAAQIDPPPMMHKGAGHRFVSGLGKVADEVKILLDIEWLLGDTAEESAQRALTQRTPDTAQASDAR